MDNIRPPLTKQDTDKINLPSGISIREYMATHILSGLLADPNIGSNPDKTAVMALQFTDALITELNRTKQ